MISKFIIFCHYQQLIIRGLLMNPINSPFKNTSQKQSVKMIKDLIDRYLHHDQTLYGHLFNPSIKCPYDHEFDKERKTITIYQKQQSDTRAKALLNLLGQGTTSQIIKNSILGQPSNTGNFLQQKKPTSSFQSALQLNSQMPAEQIDRIFPFLKEQNYGSSDNIHQQMQSQFFHNYSEDEADNGYHDQGYYDDYGDEGNQWEEEQQDYYNYGTYSENDGQDPSKEFIKSLKEIIVDGQIQYPEKKMGLMNQQTFNQAIVLKKALKHQQKFSNEGEQDDEEDWETDSDSGQEQPTTKNEELKQSQSTDSQLNKSSNRVF